MPPLIKPHTRLRRRQTNQTPRHELRPGALLGRPALNIPRTGRVDAQHGDGGGFELRDYGGEGFAEGTAEGEAEDGVDDEVCGFEGFGEVGDEGDGEVVELGFEALFASIRVRIALHCQLEMRDRVLPGRVHFCPLWDSRWRGCSRIGRGDGLLLDHRRLLFH